MGEYMGVKIPFAFGGWLDPRPEVALRPTVRTPVFGTGNDGSSPSGPMRPPMLSGWDDWDRVADVDIVPRVVWTRDAWYAYWWRMTPSMPAASWRAGLWRSLNERYPWGVFAEDRPMTWDEPTQ